MNAITRRLSSLRENWRDIAWWKTRIEHRLIGGVAYSLYDHGGVDIMAEEWDTLLLLDACRLDTLRDLRPDGWPPVDSRTSRASNTWTFYEKNFSDGPYEDTVAVTANPRTTQLRADAFHDVVKVYEHDWDDSAGTVWPDVMADRTIEAHEAYPDKRIFAHWVQPHHPFVGSEEFGQHGGFDGESIWMDLRRGRLDIDEVYKAYVETFRMTLLEVQRVLDAVSGLRVVSADHGNLFGEHPWFYPVDMYGHPRGILMPELVEVPWVEFDDGTRRDVRASEPADELEDDDEELITQRLADLGYAE